MWSVIQLRACTSTPGIESYCQALVQVQAPTFIKVPQKRDQCAHLSAPHGPVVVQKLHHGERHGDQAEEDVRHRHADNQDVAGIPGHAVSEKVFTHLLQLIFALYFRCL